MNNLIFLLIFGGCSPSTKHIDKDLNSTETVYPAGSYFFTTEDEIPADTLHYSKKINYWVNGKWVGRGKHKRYVVGHWEKRIAVPPSDQGYVWVPGQYTKRPRNGRPRGWVAGHWEKR